jgi:hypothetical protein
MTSIADSSILAKLLGKRPGQRRAACDHGSLGRRPPGRRHVLDEFGVPGLRAGVVTGQRRSDLLDHPNALMSVRDLPHPPLRGMPKQVASTSQRRCINAWIGVLSGRNWPRQRRRMRQPRAVGLTTVRPPIWPPHYCDRAACNSPFSTFGIPSGCIGPSVSIV